MSKRIIVFASLLILLSCAPYSHRSYRGSSRDEFILKRESIVNEYSKQCGFLSIYPELEKHGNNLQDKSEILKKYEIGLHVIFPQGSNYTTAEKELKESLKLDSVAIIFDYNDSTTWLPIAEFTPHGESFYPGIFYKFELITIPAIVNIVTLKVPISLKDPIGETSQDCDTLVFEYWRKSDSPYPFSSTTSIKYQIHKGSHVIVTIYNSNGDEVEVVVDEFLPKGQYEFIWAAFDFPAGVYFVKIQTGDLVETKRMVLLK